MTADIWHITQFDLTLRVLLALVCGGGIGLERELSNHAAGFRTHILVCVGSAAIMLLSIYGFGDFVTEANVRLDPARLAAQVISGIGFLGAGAIMRSGTSVKGLTTAASIWVVAAIGLCIGAGFLYCAFLVTSTVIVCLFILNKIEKQFMRNRRDQQVMITFIDHPGDLGKITSSFGEHGIQVNHIQIATEERTTGNGLKETIIEAKFKCRTMEPTEFASCLESLHRVAEIVSIEAKTPSGNDLSGKGKKKEVAI